MNGISIELERENGLVGITKDKSIYYIVKRIFDIIVSSILFVALIPLFFLIMLFIRLDSKGNSIYKHKRLGKGGSTIYIYKFRTMYQDADERLEELLKDPIIKKEWESHFKLRNDPRITRIGKILRKTSLDELPQLMNILNGDMSLIGPRPIIDDEIEKYGLYKTKFLSVSPGLTGWWATNGRSCTSYEDRMRLELYYIEHQGVKLDLKIIIKTIVAVIIGHGAK